MRHNLNTLGASLITTPRDHPVHVSHPYQMVHPLMDYVLLIKHAFMWVVAFGQAKDKNTKVVSLKKKKLEKEALRGVILSNQNSRFFKIILDLIIWWMDSLVGAFISSIVKKEFSICLFADYLGLNNYAIIIIKARSLRCM